MIFNGDCLTMLDEIGRVETIIADPPDNLGLEYFGYLDSMPEKDYYEWLESVMIQAALQSNHFWLSYYWRHDLEISRFAKTIVSGQKKEWKKYIWRFTFGQHRESDCGSGYRIILRLSSGSVSTDEIRVPSLRQTRYNDSRANPAGRVPDDVWEFPRVTGNSHERREWHPTQHPIAVYHRILRLSSKPGDSVIDLFGGTGTLLRCNGSLHQDARRKVAVAELSGHYCHQMSVEHQLPVIRDAAKFAEIFNSHS